MTLKKQFEIISNVKSANYKTLQIAVEVIDDLLIGPYEKVGNFGYFYKFDKIMNYNDGKFHRHSIFIKLRFLRVSSTSGLRIFM